MVFIFIVKKDMLHGVRRFPTDLLGGGFQGDVGDVQIISSSGAFAFLKPDGSVMALGDADAGGDCSAVQAIFSMPGVKRWMSSISMFTLNQRMGRCRVFRWVVIWIMIFEHFDMYGNNEPIVSDVGSNWMYFYTLQIYGWNISFLQQKISRFYPMIRLEHLELIADRISSMVWWKLLREDLRLPRWEGMAKLSLGVTAVGVEIATKSLTSCGLPKLRSKKSGGGWCVMVLWRFGWLVGLWDAFMTSQNHVCLMWKTQMANARHFYDHAFHFQLFSTWFPSCTPRYFGNESLPLCLGWGHSYVRGRHVPPQEANPGLYQKSVFLVIFWIRTRDIYIIVAGKEIFNDVLGHVWNKEAWGVWHISFLQWNIVKAFFSERKRNESFQTKRKSIRNFARVPWQPLVSWAIWCHETWPFYDWSIWCEAGPFVAIDGFPGSTSCGFPNVQVATLAQLDAQLRASQTDFWGMWGEWWEGDGWEMRARRA